MEWNEDAQEVLRIEIVNMSPSVGTLACFFQESKETVVDPSDILYTLPVILWVTERPLYSNNQYGNDRVVGMVTGNDNLMSVETFSNFLGYLPITLGDDTPVPREGTAIIMAQYLETAKQMINYDSESASFIYE